MGASAGSAGGYTARNSRRRGSRKVMSDINVTPMVDVMLVLLIVFMVAAPLMTVGVPLELPKTAAKQLDTKTEPISISVKADGSTFVQDQPIGLDALGPKLAELAKNGPDEQLQIRADTNVPYGRVMEVMGALNQAGYKKIGLITDAANSKAPAAAPKAAKPTDQGQGQ